MFWELESLGIANEESSVYDKFIDTIDFRNGRYEVHLLWRDEYVILSDNYDLSRKQLMGLLKRLRQAADIPKEYNTVIQDQLSRGIIENVEPSYPTEAKRIHYIPHQLVNQR